MNKTLGDDEEKPVFPGCQPIQMSACSLPHRPAVEPRSSKRQGRGHHLFMGRGDSAVRDYLVSGTGPHQPAASELYRTSRHTMNAAA